jgi:molybdopterin/thiamine biosynthesis adenylyltransferase
MSLLLLHDSVRVVKRENGELMQDADRYSRQVRFEPLGERGQKRLLESRVAVVGVGALGGASAIALLRAGVRRLRLIDRDLAEVSNLPRQLLLTEADVDAGLPKAVAAAEHLALIDRQAELDPRVQDLTADSCDELLRDVDLVIDGSDNFEARFLINEWCCRQQVPWIYGGAIGAEGRVLTILPGTTACLRCVVPEPPTPGELPTCQTAGIMGPVAMVVGAVQAAEAIKLLAADPGDRAARCDGRMLVFELWEGRWRRVDLSPLAAEGCPTCRDGETPWLSRHSGGATTVLCGRDAVQIGASGNGRIDLDQVARTLEGCEHLTTTPWMVRAEVEPGVSLTLFRDGRTIVFGTNEPARARSVVAKYLGH